MRAQALAALSALLLAGTHPAGAQTETVLYRFQGVPDGGVPFDHMPVLDKAGNLYGTTLYGGTDNLGTLWKLTPSGIETVLWSFGNGTDGALPLGLFMDKRGNLYGATLQGGTDNLGTVFKVTPSGTETVLWNFGSGTDGATPMGGVTEDKDGNFFGTTSAGGAHNGGTVFELTSSGTEKVLWSFGNGTDGLEPDGPVLNVNGTLYGTTRLGGAIAPNQGTVWKLTPSGTETVLHSFGYTHGVLTDDGLQPDGNVVMDGKGNLYGNCHTAGHYANGTTFKLMPSGKFKVLHAFQATEGTNPYASVALKNGSLYSTAHAGGAYNGGSVWQLTLKGKLAVLWSFGNGTDGDETTSGVVLDKSGNVYGLTDYGGGTPCQFDRGHPGCGVVFKVTP
jgi:uncharacterized repeat protein (TIGR03803 family)